LRYAVTSLEITTPLPEIALERDQRGLALLVRRNDRPIGFILQPLAPATTLGPDELSGLISAWCGVDLLEDKLREELHEPAVRSSRSSVTVAVCTRDHPELLAKCLHSLTRVRNAHDGASFEILVIDNAPPDEQTRGLVRSLGDVRYVREPRPGLDFARNRALVEATTDFVAFLDDDAEADRGWWVGLEEALSENPDAAVITGLVLPFELESDAQIMFERRGGFRRGFTKLRYRGDRLPGNPLYPTGAGIFGAGCNMVVHRQIALQLGGFDEALDTGPPLPGGGDIDMFYRVLRAGHPLVYEPRMLVFHKHRRETERLRRQYWTWGTGFMAFVAKTYATDPSQRQKLRHLMRWWLVHHLNELRYSVRGRGAATPGLVASELIGGLVGLAGTYQRSVRRIDRIRRDGG
jgi:glycosyltransferase involved in cell wall biosynthesis